VQSAKADKWFAVQAVAFAAQEGPRDVEDMTTEELVAFLASCSSKA
jgi:hypothetical protein